MEKLESHHVLEKKLIFIVAKYSLLTKYFFAVRFIKIL